ncbi:hypothetical protein M0R45_031255 [Rubus argutus]|uniref:Uncharacterized protein n=1 Tax=Rubus argutus TaxID=59490 RepID=A0AAW1WDG7_RUBAR
MQSLKSNKSECFGLKKIRTLSRFANLVDLNMSGCRNLVEIEVGFLKKLVNLDLGGCRMPRRHELTKVPTCNIFPTDSVQVSSLPDKQYDPHPLMVYLNRCSNLVEISEFPREIYGLDASGCHASRRISRLSNILEGKESRMIPWMDLSGCDELCS